MTITITRAGTSATADAILDAPLSRRLNREVIDTAGGPLVNAGTPARLSGRVVYLFHSLAGALAADTVYRGVGTVTLATGAGQPLDGLDHVAVGELRYGVERAPHGVPPRWTLSVEIREV